jgi:hypothetical protein
MNEFTDKYKEEGGVAFAQTNIRVPTHDKEQVIALGYLLRAEYLRGLVDTDNVDVLYEVASMNMPKLPELHEIINLRDTIENEALAALLRVAYESLMISKEHSSQASREKRGSDVHTAHVAKAVAYGKMAEAYYNDYVVKAEKSD